MIKIIFFILALSLTAWGADQGRINSSGSTTNTSGNSNSTTEPPLAAQGDDPGSTSDSIKTIPDKPAQNPGAPGSVKNPSGTFGGGSTNSGMENK